MNVILVVCFLIICLNEKVHGNYNNNKNLKNQMNDDQLVLKDFTKVKYDPTFILSVDSWFIDHYLDPFDDEQVLTVPPVIIAENYLTDSIWEKGEVVVPALVSSLHVDFWHGTQNKVRPFKEQDVFVKVLANNPNLFRNHPKVELSQVGATTKLIIDMKCVRTGSTPLTVKIERQGHPAFYFKIFKKCEKKKINDLIIGIRKNTQVFGNSEVNPAFNVHDLTGRAFVADKRDVMEDFVIHTLETQYKIVSEPKVRAYAARQDFLQWTKSRFKSLGDQIDDFLKTSDDFSNKEVEFYEEEEDETYDEDDDYDYDNYNPLIDKGPLKTSPPTYSLNLNPKSSTVREPSISCSPNLSGSIMNKFKNKGVASIIHRKDFGEKSLGGFSQAGVLGMHGASELKLRYNCLRDGLNIIELAFDVMPNYPGNQKYKIKPQRIELSWLKICLAKKISENNIDLMGFNIHLGTYSRDEPSHFPILNGITGEQFTYESASMVASPEELSTSFYVRETDLILDARDKQSKENRTNEEYIRIQGTRFVNSHRYKRVLRPTLTGHGVIGGIVTDESLPIKVTYNCRQSGKVRIGIDLWADVVKLDKENNPIPVPGRAKKITFFWKKHCSITKLDHLSARTVDPELYDTNEKIPERQKLISEKVFNSVPILAKNNLNPLFVEKKTSELDRSLMYNVLPEQEKLAIEFRKDGIKRNAMGKLEGQRDRDSQMGLLFRKPILSSSSSHVKVSLRDISILEDMQAMGKENILWNEGLRGYDILKADENHLFEKETVFEVTTKDPAYFIVVHECLSVGPSLITLQVPVYTNNEQTISIQWMKQCGNFTQSSISGQKAEAYLTFFVILAVILTALSCFVYIKKQKREIFMLKQRVKPGFESMDIKNSN